MDTIQALQERVSIGVLGAPGPSSEDIDTLLTAAVRAPDHGVLRPWRFLVLEGEQLHQLGEVFVEAALQNNPNLPAEEQEKARTRPLRAPCIIVVVSENTLEHKIPVLDQVLAAGAAAQNIIVAAHALGIGAMWRTGAVATHPHVKQQLGFQDKDDIVGFIYLGTPAGSIKNVPPTNYRDYLRDFPRDFPAKG